MGNQIILDGHKLAWHKDRVEKFLRGERFAPISIEFALTRACTYHCVYCYSKLQYNDSKKMTWPIINSFLEDAKDIGVLSMNLTSDGESTCSPYFLDTVIHGNSIGLDMACATNGYLLPNNSMDNLTQLLRSLTYLRFNISAGKPKRYSEIHGVPESYFYEVINKIKEAVEIKRKYNLPVTLGLQMVLLSKDEDQILPLAQLGKDIGADYLVIKHCSDDEFHTLGIDYQKYFEMTPTIKKAEALSDENYLVKAKWSKLLSGGKRTYERCYGPPFMLQFSGSGLVAPCGMLFNERYKGKFHLGNITETRFRDIFNSDRYWEVMKLLGSGIFDPKTMCGSLCLQHGINQYLWDLKESGKQPAEPVGQPPQHINFP